MFVTFRIVSSAISLILVVPFTVLLLLLDAIPGYDFSPSKVFHRLRTFFFRLFAGRTFRRITLRARLPAGPSITSRGNTTI
jgi:hypothetical protein